MTPVSIPYTWHMAVLIVYHMAYPVFTQGIYEDNQHEKPSGDLS